MPNFAIALFDMATRRRPGHVAVPNDTSVTPHQLTYTIDSIIGYSDAVSKAFTVARELVSFGEDKDSGFGGSSGDTKLNQTMQDLELRLKTLQGLVESFRHTNFYGFQWIASELERKYST